MQHQVHHPTVDNHFLIAAGTTAQIILEPELPAGLDLCTQACLIDPATMAARCRAIKTVAYTTPNQKLEQSIVFERIEYLILIMAWLQSSSETKNRQMVTICIRSGRGKLCISDQAVVCVPVSATQNFKSHM